MSSSPAMRFQAAVLGATAVVGGAVLLPVLTVLKAKFLSQQGSHFMSVALWATGYLITYLMTVGTYKTVAVVLEGPLLRIRWLKRLVMGPYYLEGTWLGWYDAGHGKQLLVEYFEQTLDETVIRGSSYDRTTGDLTAQWHSLSVNLDTERGTLAWLSQIRISNQNISTESVITLSLGRMSNLHHAIALDGYAADIAGGIRVALREEKWLDYGEPDLKKALDEAAKRF